MLMMCFLLYIFADPSSSSKLWHRRDIHVTGMCILDIENTFLVITKSKIHLPKISQEHLSIITIMPFH